MPNIASVLKSEISRVARKEVRSEIQTIRKAATTHRREIAALKRRIAELDRKIRSFGKFSGSVSIAEAKDQVGPPTRFVAKGLVSLRKRLGLSAADMARLLDVSMQSVYNWERKKATPRKEQIAAIVALRSIGKKEAIERLEAPRIGKASGERTRRPQSRKRARKLKAAR